MPSPRLTQQELRAINEALASRLAGPLDDDGPAREVYESAKAKIEGRIRWRPDELGEDD